MATPTVGTITVDQNPNTLTTYTFTNAAVIDADADQAIATITLKELSGFDETISSVTIDPGGGDEQAMTVWVDYSDVRQRVGIAYVKAADLPPNGTYDLRVVMTGDVADMKIGFVNIKDWDETTPAADTNTNSDDTPTVTVTTDTEDLVIDAATCGVAGSWTMGGGQTVVFNGDIGGFHGSSSYEGGGASTTVMSWTIDGGGINWAIAAVKLGFQDLSGGDNAETSLDTIRTYQISEKLRP